MCETSMMPLRVAMPNRVMKPTIDATESTPPARYTPTTPPISASGRLSMIEQPVARRAECRREDEEDRDDDADESQRS